MGWKSRGPVVGRYSSSRVWGVTGGIYGSGASRWVAAKHLGHLGAGTGLCQPSGGAGFVDARTAAVSPAVEPLHTSRGSSIVSGITGDCGTSQLQYRPSDGLNSVGRRNWAVCPIRGLETCTRRGSMCLKVEGKRRSRMSCTSSKRGRFILGPRRGQL